LEPCNILEDPSSDIYSLSFIVTCTIARIWREGFTGSDGNHCTPKTCLGLLQIITPDINPDDDHNIHGCMTTV
jgi:hypothetical protein